MVSLIELYRKKNYIFELCLDISISGYYYGAVYKNGKWARKCGKKTNMKKKNGGVDGFSMLFLKPLKLSFSIY